MVRYDTSSGSSSMGEIISGDAVHSQILLSLFTINATFSCSLTRIAPTRNSLGDKFFDDDELETSEAWLLRAEARLKGARGATGFTLGGLARAVRNSRLAAYSFF